MAEPERRIFTRLRKQLPISKELDELERDYSNINYIHFDIPRIKANDHERFLAWYNSNSKPVCKIGTDIAGGTSQSPHFRSVDTYNGMGRGTWETNYRPDLWTEFPELRDQLMQLPIQAIPNCSIWQNLIIVRPHRDQGPWRDLPCSFRILLHDEHVEPTQILEETPPNSAPVSRFTIPKFEETNAFGWNNLRTKHSTKPTPGKPKMLLILHSPLLKPRAFRDLLERSVAKYGKHAYYSSSPASAFYDAAPDE